MTREEFILKIDGLHSIIKNDLLNEYDRISEAKIYSQNEETFQKGEVVLCKVAEQSPYILSFFLDKDKVSPYEDYSYCLDNLYHIKKLNQDKNIPEKRELKVGDKVRHFKYYDIEGVIGSLNGIQACVRNEEKGIKNYFDTDELILI